MRLRKVRPSDIQILWAWANDPITRGMAFQLDAIPWARHEAWFAERLQSRSCYWYICEDSDGRLVGQVRFDVGSAGDAEVDVSVAPEIRGRGYGRQMIALATRTVFRDAPEAQRTVAHVRLENEASLRAFTAAGYQRVGEPTIKGVPAAEFVRGRESQSAVRGNGRDPGDVEDA